MSALFFKTLYIIVCCNINALFSFDLSRGYIPEYNQQLRTLKLIHADARNCTL